jgi:hypothetical protein
VNFFVDAETSQRATGKFVDEFRPKALSSDQPLGGFNNLPWSADYADVLFASEIGAKGDINALKKMFDINEQYRLAIEKNKRIYFAKDEQAGVQNAGEKSSESRLTNQEIASLNASALDISQDKMLDDLNSTKELTETGLRFLPNLGIILGDGPDRSVEHLFSDGRLYAVILRGKGYGGHDRRSGHLETSAYYDALLAKYGSPEQRDVPKGGGFLTYCTWRSPQGTLVMVVEPGSGEGASSVGDGSLTGRTHFIVTYSNDILAGADERIKAFKAQAEQNAAVAEQVKIKHRQQKASELIDRL